MCLHWGFILLFKSIYMAKQYKNIYTILEKVKKGELDSYYKYDGGLFGKLNFYKKKDLVKQHLHYLDEKRLENIMQCHLKEKIDFHESFQEFQKSSDYIDKIPDVKKPDFDNFMKKVTEIYNQKFPKHLLNDVFKMYYNKIEKLDFEDRDDKNLSKFKLLEVANNPVGKIMSENSQLKSSVFSRSAISYFLSQLAMLSYVNPEAAKKIENSLKDDSNEFDNQDADEIIKETFNNQMSKDMLENSMKKAQDLCKSLDGIMSDDQQNQMFDACQDNASEAGKLNTEFINDATRRIERIKISMTTIKNTIKKLMDKSKSYFSAKEETIYEDLFNADSISGLDQYELLHPMLRKVMSEDIMIKDTKKIGKIDLYVDISGSMSSNVGIDVNGISLSKLDFCKSFLYQMKQMDMLNKVYLFKDSVKECNIDPISIAMISESGGTNIDRAVDKINKNGVNSIIITDAEDRCTIYSDKAFFIGVKGCDFCSFDAKIIKEYSEKDQVIVFDGTKIEKVDIVGCIM